VQASQIRHDLFVYDADDAFAAQLERYLIAGLDADERVIVVTSARKQAILRDVLDTDAERVSFADVSEVYTRPEDAQARFDAIVRSPVNAGEPGVRVYGELPECRTREEWNAWIAYEAIANVAYADSGAAIMCGYDERVVPEEVVRQAWQAHPVVHAGAWQMSPDYRQPEELVRSLTPAFEPIDGLRAVGLDDPGHLQDRLAEELDAAAVPESRARDMLVAAREVLANAERHGNGVRRFRVGRVGARVVCEVTDAGSGFDDPLAGYLPPRPLGDDRAGLWIARQLTSRLELDSQPDGLTVRLWG
jgi:anti-sigma regulatory factor (Ser/Thr protein kinase)